MIISIIRMSEDLTLGMYIGIQKKYFEGFHQPIIIKSLPKVNPDEVKRLSGFFEVEPVYIDSRVNPIRVPAEPIDGVSLKIELGPKEVTPDVMDSPWSFVVCNKNNSLETQKVVNPVLEEITGPLLFIPVSDVLRGCDQETKESILSLYYSFSRSRLMALKEGEFKQVRFDSYSSSTKECLGKLLQEMAQSALLKPESFMQDFRLILQEPNHKIKKDLVDFCRLISEGDEEKFKNSFDIPSKITSLGGALLEMAMVVFTSPKESFRRISLVRVMRDTDKENRARVIELCKTIVEEFGSEETEEDK